MLGYIYGVGGWQTYISNKLKLMKENGWDVYAISNDLVKMKGDMLPFLETYKNNRIDAFSFTYVSELKKALVDETCSRVKEMINFNDGDEVIVEATVLYLFLWAEYLAQSMNGRSICVETSNRFAKYCNETLDFFHFKAQRGELLFMSKTGLREVFDGYIEYPEIDNNSVGALTQDEYADDGKDYKAMLKTDEYDYVIGTLGWLDKGYYKILIDEVIKFCNAHTDKKVQFIVIGNSLKGNIEKEYEQKAADIPNLKLSLMGAIAPVPSNLIKLFDVSVASYGCASIIDKLGVTTISMHDPEYIPLGILSYTIIKAPFNARINFDKTIYDMLSDILIDKLCDRMEKKPFPTPEVEQQKKTHLERIASLPEKIEHYDVMKLKCTNANLKHKIKVMFYKIFGIKATLKLCSLYKGK
ncbi:MAG: hypothetical protein IJZ72_04885 [Oscillospiraceae bacterium]|nr:hypothetical protein [Oscillospiraceae bacterium]